MARPSNTVRGFIEIEWEANISLLSVENILAVIPNGTRTTIVLRNAIDRYDTKMGTVNISYDEVIGLIREATR